MSISRLGIVRVGVLSLAGLIQVPLILRLGQTANGPDAETYIRNSSGFSSLETLLDPAAFGSNYWVAGYSGFIRLFSGLGSWNLTGVRVAQVLMYLSMAVMAYLLTRHLSEMIASITLVVVAFSPTLMWFSLVIAYEVLFAWLITLSLTMVWCSKRGSPIWLFIFAGFVLSMALIVQFKAVVIVPVLAVLAVRIGYKPLLTFLAGLSVPVCLWTLRNWVATGQPIPWTTNGSINVWIGNNPESSGGYFDYPPVPAGWGGGDAWIAGAVNFAVLQPREFLALQATKAARFFYPNAPLDYHVSLPATVDALLVALQWASAALVLLLFIIFLCGLVWRLGGTILSLSPLALIVLLMFAVNMPFISEPRFRVAVEPILLAVCVPTAFALVSRWVSRGTGDAGELVKVS